MYLLHARNSALKAAVSRACCRNPTPGPNPAKPVSGKLEDHMPRDPAPREHDLGKFSLHGK